MFRREPPSWERTPLATKSQERLTKTTQPEPPPLRFNTKPPIAKLTMLDAKSGPRSAQSPMDVLLPPEVSTLMVPLSTTLTTLPPTMLPRDPWQDSPPPPKRRCTNVITALTACTTNFTNTTEFMTTPTRLYWLPLPVKKPISPISTMISASTKTMERNKSSRREPLTWLFGCTSSAKWKTLSMTARKTAPSKTATTTLSMRGTRPLLSTPDP
mmetsp:Transcript_7180/g.15329  ORF Transcript_7180/g.15329 Transcript_7180/m.15329 type:complete len:213 (-) Transcript_7180:867-1505(-)